MKKILLIATSLLCMVYLSSCSDFLDQKPSQSVDADDFEVRSAQDAKVMLNGVLKAMISGSYYGRDMLLYADAKGSDYTIGSQGRGYDYLYRFSHSPSSSSGSQLWAQIYFCLLQVNTLLSGIDQAEAGGNVEEDLSLYKGQALTLRALMHFDLVRLYGKPYTYSDAPASYGVPVATEILPTTAKPTRATVQQVYGQILADLEVARVLMDTDAGKKVDKAGNGYINYYGNRAIQARVYLYMGNFDDALTAAEKIITDNKYSLYSPSIWVDSWSREYGPESIFELGITLNDGDLGVSSLGALLLARYEVSSSVQGLFMASDYFLTRLNEGYDGVNDSTKDVRWGLMFPDETSTPTAERLGSCRKYVGVGLKGDKGSYSAVNIKVIRLSEMYLIAAEAAMRATTPDLTKAASYLNEIRKRSPNLAPATVATIDLDMILDERSKELFMEGHRYFDLTRNHYPITFNDEFIDVGSISAGGRPKTINQNGEFYYRCILPIPLAELNANPAIVGQQNPEY